MKRTILLTIPLLLFGCIYIVSLHAVKTVYIPRSQGHAPSMVCMPAYDYTFITSLNYGQSYKGENIARDLFGSSVLNISGSQVPNRKAGDILADNFGLAPDFQSTISFSPSIENTIFSVYYNMPLDNLLSGLYVNFTFPVAYSVWDLHPCERVINRGVTVFPDGYMGDTLVTFTPTPPLPLPENPCACAPVKRAPSPAAPAQTGASAREYLSGNVITGDILRPLAYNKISWCPLKRTELAEFIIRLGRNFICSDYTHASVFARASFQTGNKQAPYYLFSPVCGNGKFFELGLGTQGQYQFTHLDNPTQVTFLWDASLEHLFKNKQLRTFDLLGVEPCTTRKLSRYLLLKKINRTSLNYDGELIEASYFSTLPAYVSRAIQGDIDLKLDISHKGFVQTIGYAMWGTTEEHLCPVYDQPTCPTSGNVYAIKGTSGAYYYTDGTLTALAPLNATESSSTITQAGPIDNPLPLVGTVAWDNTTPAVASNSPLILGCINIDVDSARSPAQLTHAFFAEMGYRWDGCHTAPTILFGGSIETANDCPAELHQWSVWVKGELHW